MDVPGEHANDLGVAGEHLAEGVGVAQAHAVEERDADPCGRVVVMPSAEALGLDTAGIPNANELEAVSSFISGLDAQLLVVGEDEDTDWRVAGRVVEENLHGDLDGRARVVGKVEKVIRPGRWQPYLAFPGMKVIGREAARRRMEREGPKVGEGDQYLPGPALMLDILAIYR